LELVARTKPTPAAGFYKNGKHPKTQRAWGYYRVLHEAGAEVKVKELTVEPGQRLSMQRHQQRAEHWFVSEGTATVYTIDRSSDAELLGEFTTHQHIHINRGEWHQLCNLTDHPLRVVEIQYGAACVEEDIERQ
jgi:mannose-6-phosphate isomerase